MVSNECVFVVSSQLTALAMLLLDPYYRTIEGFEVYIHFRCSWHKSLVSLLLLLFFFLPGSYRKGMDKFRTQVSAGKV